MTTKAVFTICMSPPFRDIRGRYAKGEENLLRYRQQELKPEARRLVKLLKEEAPEKTGKFKSGITYRTFVSGNTVSFRTYTPKPLGDYILEGTKPHIIRARRSSTLKFYWEKGPRGAGVYFYPQVHHPGTKPNRFVGRAYRRWLPGARSCLSRIALRYVRYIQGASK